MFERGLTHGSTGNISAKLDDGWLLTPTGSSFGRIDPARISRLDWSGKLLAGDPPSKEAFLHLGMYQERAQNAAVVHLHSVHSVAVSVLEEVDPQSLGNLPAGLDGDVYRWIDLHGEGIPGILTEQAGAWFYKRNLSPIPGRAQFAPLETVALTPNAPARRVEFLDLAGDGQPDIVVLAGQPLHVERDLEQLFGVLAHLVGRQVAAHLPEVEC